jgi:hypothetical protein
MRCNLRTLLIVLALGPPVLAGAWAFASRFVPVGGDIEGPSVTVRFETACTFEPEDESQVDAP